MMKKYKLKDKYRGLKVTRSNITIGKITFDANTTKEEHYENYYNLGFVELFDVIEEVKPEPKKEIIVEDKPKPKRKPRTRKNGPRDNK